MRRGTKRAEQGQWARSITAVGLALLASVPAAVTPVTAQLRPLDPLDWRVWDAGSWLITLGTAFYSGQRASLAGTEGELYELGVVTASLHLDRVVLQVHGTIARVYDESGVFAEPLGGARGPNGHRRVDTSDHQIQTIVRLVDGDGPFSAALRFGVRLPTTNNTVGLERDQTDFFALLAGRATTGLIAVSGEIGLGVYGTRLASIEQVDPVLYGLGIRLEGQTVTPVLQLVGQWDTRPGAPLRGVEDLTEVRIGIEAGRRRSIALTAIRDLKEFSPDYGLRLTVGAQF